MGVNEYKASCGWLAYNKEQYMSAKDVAIALFMCAFLQAMYVFVAYVEG